MLGPIPANASVGFVNDPGVEAEAFLYQAAHAQLAAGHDVVYVAFNRAPSSVRREFEEYGFSAPTKGGKLVFVDGFSPLMGSTENAEFELKQPQTPEALVATLESAAKAHPGAMLVLDPLTALFDQGSAAALVHNLEALRRSLKRFRLVVAMLTRWPYGDDFTKLLAAFDALVNVRAIEDRVVLQQYFQIARAAWHKQVEQRRTLFRSTKPGGVLVYIPKILITGPYHAGKSTFVHTLSDTAVSADRMGTTVAVDHGHITIDGVTADIFGTPGQERFDPLLPVLAGQALGVVVVVDSTQPESFVRAHELMDRVSKVGLPIIVAANKQDVKGALQPAEIARRMATPIHIRVVGCRATEKESTRDVLRQLLQQIMTGVPA